MFPMFVMAGAAMRKIATVENENRQFLDESDAVATLLNADLQHAARLNRTINAKQRWAAIAKLGGGQ